MALNDYVTINNCAIQFLPPMPQKGEKLGDHIRADARRPQSERIEHGYLAVDHLPSAQGADM